MDPKKNPKYDLNRYSGLFFSIGLALTLFVVWQMIEWKNYDKSIFDYQALHVMEESEEEIPVTEQIKTPPPPPPPPPAPEIIQVVDDEVEVEETIIESTETDQNEIVDVEEVEVDEVEEVTDVPFAIIEQIPLFPGCDKVPKKEQKNCFQDRINAHIRKTFRYPQIAQDLGVQGKVYVSFVIDRDGKITNIRSRGPDKNLTKEAERIIAALPQMIPGKQRGKPVRVPYSVPISFQLR
ncbi:MAG: energy transducer TonB [Flavobacteriaceae bacterium]